jgi:hypothetical protein
MLTPNLITNALVPLVRERQEEQNEEDQTNHRDTRILMWKTLQSEGKNHGHQPATTFTIFVECLQERRDLFRWLTRGLYSKTQASRRRASASLANLATFKEFGSYFNIVLPLISSSDEMYRIGEKGDSGVVIGRA